ncbi:transposase family protein [Streptomyces lacrimifluminis]
MPVAVTRQHRLIGPLTLRLQTLADPRHRRGNRHSFVSVVLIACSAVLTGARSFASIGQWARSGSLPMRRAALDPRPRRESRLYVVRQTVRPAPVHPCGHCGAASRPVHYWR